MTYNIKSLVSGSLMSTGALVFYTAPANTKAVIHNMTLYNSSSGALTATVYLNDTGSSADAAHTVIGARVLAGKETYRCPEMIGKSMSATGTISGLASATGKIAIQANGVEVT